MFKATKEGLKETLRIERQIYLSSSVRYRFMEWLKQTEKYQIWRYVRALRYVGYHKYNYDKNIWHKLASIYWRRVVNIKGTRLGLIIGPQAFDEGLILHHIGPIVADGDIGKNCQLHGDNCIGRSHGLNDTPTLGDNVRLGVGAKVIGDIYIANNVTIAAGAIVTKSCYEEGVTLAGIPAKIIKKSTTC